MSEEMKHSERMFNIFNFIADLNEWERKITIIALRGFERLKEN